MINSSDDLLRATFPEYFDSFGRPINPEIYDPYVAFPNMIQRNIPTATGTKMVQEPEGFYDDDMVSRNIPIKGDDIYDMRPAMNEVEQANLNAELEMGKRNVEKMRENKMSESRLTNMEKESEQYNKSSPRETESKNSFFPSTTGMGPYSGSYAQADPISDEELLERATDAPYDEDTSPFGRDVRGILRGITGYGTIEETKKEILARQIEKEQGKNLNLIQTKGDTTGYLEKGVSDEELARITQAEKFYEGLMNEGRPTGTSPLQDRFESDSKTISRYFANNPDEYAQLQAYQKEFGEKEGLLKFAEQGGYQPIEEIEVNATERRVLEEIQQDASDDPNSTKQQVAVTGDGTPIVNKGTTINQTGGSKGVTDDAFLAEEQRLSKAKEEIFKGNMDRKWMAIAAGAFNAAQRGAPTLIQGLADLGSDVTGELQKLDKEDQDRAIALHEIYLQEATLAENKRKADLVYNAAMYGHNLDSLKNIADRIGKTSKEVLDATKAFDTAKKNKTLGDFGTEQYIGSVIDYADLGVVSAGLEYNQEISKLKSKENEIKLDIEDFDPNNPEHVAEATKEFMEYLEDNPDKKSLVSDFWKKIEGGGTMPFDIRSSLTLKPRM
jgi:hypothetical protein